MNSQNNIDLHMAPHFKEVESDNEDTEKVKKMPDYIKNDAGNFQSSGGSSDSNSSGSDSESSDSESSNSESNKESSVVQTPDQVSNFVNLPHL
jgi:hypothetical protein